MVAEQKGQLGSGFAIVEQEVTHQEEAQKMKASRFECRRQTLIHLVLVGLSALTYTRDRVDIVWSLVRNHSDSAS